MQRSTREAARKLLAIVQEQGGYFTAKQAKVLGYGYPHLKYHVSTGSFERVGHGVYRLSGVVPAANDDLIRLSLWSPKSSMPTPSRGPIGSTRGPRTW